MLPPHSATPFAKLHDQYTPSVDYTPRPFACSEPCASACVRCCCGLQTHYETELARCAAVVVRLASENAELGRLRAKSVECAILSGEKRELTDRLGKALLMRGEVSLLESRLGEIDTLKLEIKNLTTELKNISLYDSNNGQTDTLSRMYCNENCLNTRLDALNAAMRNYEDVYVKAVAENAMLMRKCDWLQYEMATACARNLAMMRDNASLKSALSVCQSEQKRLSVAVCQMQSAAVLLQNEVSASAMREANAVDAARRAVILDAAHACNLNNAATAVSDKMTVDCGSPYSDDDNTDDEDACTVTVPVARAIPMKELVIGGLTKELDAQNSTLTLLRRQLVNHDRLLVVVEEQAAAESLLFRKYRLDHQVVGSTFEYLLNHNHSQSTHETGRARELRGRVRRAEAAELRAAPRLGVGVCASEGGPQPPSPDRCRTAGRRRVEGAVHAARPRA